MLPSGPSSDLGLVRTACLACGRAADRARPLGIDPDLLSRSAKRDRTVRLGPDVVLSLVAAAALAPVALTAAVVAPLAHSGASMQLVATPASQPAGLR